MATHSSVFAWRIPGTGEPGGLPTMGSHRVRHDWSDLAAAAVFLELSCFFDDPADVGHLISGSSAFSKTSLNIWKFTIHVLLKPGLENFEHYFTSVWDECRIPRFSSWVRKIHWRSEWQPTPVFLPGEFHGQRSLVGYNQRAATSGTQLSYFTFTFTIQRYYIITVCIPTLCISQL